MTNKNLVQATRQRVNATTSWSNSVTQVKLINQNYGIDARIQDSISLSTDQVYNLIAKAVESSSNYIPTHMAGSDSVDLFVKKSFQSIFNNGDLHPMDEAFEILESALRLDAAERKLGEELKVSGKQDEVDIYVQSSYSDKTNLTHTNHSVIDLYELIDETYQFKCPSGKADNNSDPVNDFIKESYGNGRFFSEPAHSLAEWNLLLEKVTDTNPELEIIARSGDIANDMAEIARGREPLSVKAIEILREKAMAKASECYDYAEGSEARNKKWDECCVLIQARQKREANLKELNWSSITNTENHSEDSINDVAAEISKNISK